jgi:hypothetical protein
MELPIRRKPRRDIVDPREEKSKQLMADPSLVVPKILSDEPNRAKERSDTEEPITKKSSTESSW